MSIQTLFAGASILLACVAYVAPHGHISDPMARNVIWKLYPDMPSMWNSMGVWCGPPEGMGFPSAYFVPQDDQFSSCGICGDDPEQPLPRDHELGGKYGVGHIAKTYTSGQVINVTIDFNAMHYGFFQIDMCADAVETEGCFRRLELVGGTEQIRIDNRMCAPYYDGGDKTIVAMVKLPEGVTCERCTLRWTYRTAYQGYQGWFECDVDPRPAQTFRNCADIAIL